MAFNMSNKNTTVQTSFSLHVTRLPMVGTSTLEDPGFTREREGANSIRANFEATSANYTKSQRGGWWSKEKT